MMKVLIRIILGAIYVIALGFAVAVVGFWIGGLLFPQNNHDLSDATQGFIQLGIALLGLAVGVIVGGITVNRVTRRLK